MFFYEKRCPRHRPAWVTHREGVERGNDEFIDFCVVERPATLAWAASLADLELHTSLSLAREIERPTMIVFDLDPGPPADMVTCCDVALLAAAPARPARPRVVPEDLRLEGAAGLRAAQRAR